MAQLPVNNKAYGNNNSFGSKVTTNTGNQSPFGNSTSYVNSMYEQQLRSQIEALRQQQRKTTQGLNQQKKDLAPQYQAQRNSADVVNAQSVTRLRELMAANGINASGENVTAQAGLASSRQASLNDINNNQAKAVADIDKQIADVNDPSREMAIRTQLGASQAGSLLDAYNQDRQYNMQQQNYKDDKAWREYTYNNMSAAEKAQLAWAQQQYGEDAAWRMYELNYNGEIQKSTNQAQVDAYTNGLAGIP
jgi:hypothetical protein